MPPPVTETAQVRRTVATVGPHSDWHFGNARSGLGRFDERLRGKLHSDGAKIQFGCQRLGHTPHATINVTDPGTEEEIQYSGEYRRAEMAMMPRHCAIFYFARKPIANYKFIAFSPLGDEPTDLAEVVTAIGVAKDNELSARLLNTIA